MPTSLVVYLPNLAGGGAERSHINLAPELIRHGYRVTFLVNRVEGELKQHLPQGVRLVSLDVQKIGQAIIPLARFLRQERPDILLCNLYECNLAGIVAGLLSGRKTAIVASIHNAVSLCTRNSQSWKIKYLPFLYRLLLPLASGVIAVSQGVAADLSRSTGLAADKITMIYNPVITDKMAQALAAAAPPPSENPYILGVGRLTEQKDFSTLLAAFAQIAPQRPQLKLVLLGEGPLRAALTAQAESLGLADRVSLPGYTTDALPVLRNAALYVMSSRYEGLGNALIEALACGTPALSTDCPHGPAEILENGKWGALVPVGDVAALTRAMMAALDRPLPAASLRQRGMMFTAQRAGDAYDAFLKKLIG